MRSATMITGRHTARGTVGGVLAAVAAVAVGGGCQPLAIERASPLEAPACTPPDEVDGLPARPIGVGELVEGILDGADDAAPGAPAGAVGEAGDVDRFSFCGRAGHWVVLDFEDTPFLPLIAVGQGSARYAENRLAGFDASSDTQFLPFEDGVYTIELSPRLAEAPRNYAFTLQTHRDHVEIERGELPSTAPSSSSPSPSHAPLALDGTAQLWGSLDAAVDADVVLLAPIEEPGLIRAQLALAGVPGNGSTLFPLVELLELDAGGAERVVGSADLTTTAQLLAPVAPRADGAVGSYALRVRSSRAAGERPFYAVEHVSFEARALAVEENDGGNSSLSGAQPLLPVGTSTRAVDVLVDLVGPDLDMFSFFVDADDTFGFSCSAAATGSGLRGLVAAVHDGDGNVLSRAREEMHLHEIRGGSREIMTPATALVCGAAEIGCDLRYDANSEGAGEYFVSVQAIEDPAGDVDGRWAVCTAFIQGP